MKKRIRSLLLAALIIFVFNHCSHPKRKLTLALPGADWWTAAPFLISEYDSLLQLSALDISVFEVNSGLASKNAVVAGTADIGITAATPLALAASKREGLVVLGTYMTSYGVVGLIRSKNDDNDLPLTPIAIVPSTISEWFLYEYLRTIKMDSMMVENKINELHVRPADIPGSLSSGSAKSAVIWEPFLTFCESDENFRKDTILQNFQVQLYIITRKEIVDELRDDVEKYVEVLKKSCEKLTTSSIKSQKQIEKHFKFKDGFLSRAWSKMEYSFKQDRDRMKVEIKRDSEIAKSLGYIDDIPEFEYFFNHDLFKIK